MDALSDCHGDVVLDDANHSTEVFKSECAEPNENEINSEITQDNNDIDHLNTSNDEDIQTPSDTNLVNLDNDIMQVKISESEEMGNDTEKCQEKCTTPEKNDTSEAVSTEVSVQEIVDSQNPSPKPEKSTAPSKIIGQPSAGSKCEVCATTVYPMEKVILDAKIYHQNCFRCCKCKKALSATVVSKSGQNLFCKPHYIELFRMRGKYDDINVNKCQSDSLNNYVPSEGSSNFYQDHSGDGANSTYTYTPSEKKEITVSAKDLAKRFQEGTDNVQENQQRKPPIDIGVKNRVAGWVEGQTDKEPDFKRRNSNNNYAIELDNVNQSAKGCVKNMKAKFEVQN